MSKRQYKKLVSVAFTLIIGLVLIHAGYIQKHMSVSSESNSKVYYSAKVIKVVDGDTAEIAINGQSKTVRFIGMDTPEVVDPRKTVQCFGREASSRAHELLDNQEVTVIQDALVGDQDKYSRLLAYVFLPNNVLYNQQMIADGYAHEYTYQNQSYKYQDQFRQAQNDAQLQQKGFWSPQTCNGDTKQDAK